MTFLVTYWAHPELLRVCLDSIRKFHPQDKIVVSQQIGEAPVQLPDGVDHIFHDMPKYGFDGVVKNFMRYVLFLNYNTDCVFIEHDCFLLKPLTPLFSPYYEGYELTGVEEVINLKGKVFRSAPGFANQNFFVLNVMDFANRYGIDAVSVCNADELSRTQRNVEPAYGISQYVHSIHFLPTKPSGYGCGTYYGDYVHHLWYGSYKGRGLVGEDIEAEAQDAAVNRLIEDYWEGKFDHND